VETNQVPRVQKKPSGGHFWGHLRVARLRVLGLYSVAAVLLLIVGINVYQTVEDRQQSDYLVAHTNEVKSVIEAMMSDVKDAESAARGFVITHNLMFASQTRRWSSEAKSGLQKLTGLVDDNPLQRKRAVEMTKLLGQKVVHMNQLLALPTTATPNTVVSYLASGSALMSAMRATADQMQREEDRLLILRTERSRNEGVQSRALLILFVCLAVAIVAVAYVLTQRELRQRQQNESLLASVLNSSQSGIIVYEALRDSEGQIIDFKCVLANPQVKQLTGIKGTPEGNTMISMFGGSIEPHAFQLYIDSVETRANRTIETYYAPISKWFRVTTVPLNDGFTLTFRAEERRGHPATAGRRPRPQQPRARAVCLYRLARHAGAAAQNSRLRRPLYGHLWLHAG
jgi:CHASE3 domain sensor protein